MFNPSDILYIVLAFCVLWLTAFLCWLIWQVAMILKNINDALADAREKMGKIESALTGMKQRLESLSSVSALFVEGLKKVVDFAMEKKKQKMKPGKKIV